MIESETASVPQRKTSKHVVAAVADLPPGTRKLVNVKGRPIVVFNIKGEYFALINRCPHQGGSLCHGSLTGLVQSSGPGQYSYLRDGEILRCPWHGWEFDIRTGQSYCEPSRIKAKQYVVGVELGSQVVEGPYVAETIPVSVEEKYVVVQL